MSTNCKREERNLKWIIRSNIKSIDLIKQIQLLNYYKNRKLKSLFIKNNLNPSKEVFKVVYKYICNERTCKETDAIYIGRTTVTTKDRFRSHASNETGSQLVPNVSVVVRRSQKEDLAFLEALIIEELNPEINRQVGNSTAPLKYLYNELCPNVPNVYFMMNFQRFCIVENLNREIQFYFFH